MYLMPEHCDPLVTTSTKYSMFVHFESASPCQVDALLQTNRNLEEQVFLLFRQLRDATALKTNGGGGGGGGTGRTYNNFDDDDDDEECVDVHVFIVKLD